MRIALVHSFYSSRQPSGENIAVESAAEVLEAAGHDVLIVDERTDERERTALYRVRTAWSVASGHGATPVERLARFQPEIVHVHNLFPNFGTRWLRDWNGALVCTVHNFRPMCAAGDLYRSGAVCTLCPDGDHWAGLRHGCYRGSRAATLPLAWRGRRGAAADPVLRRAARIVVLSERARRVYESAGVPSSKLAVIPSFVPAAADDPRASAVGAGQWLYAGRIAREKGLLELLARWPEGELLAVVGDGPLLDQARAVAGRDVSFLGPMPRQQLLAGLAGYAGLVFPSRCYEGSPMIVAEALARGLPVVALEGSSAADLVAEAGGGVTYDDEPGSLERALRTVREQRAQLSGAARAVHLTHCSPEAWLRRTEGVYAHALAQVAG